MSPPPYPVCPALLILSLFAQRVELFIHSFMLQLALMSWWTWAALRGTFTFSSQSAQYEWEWLRDCFSWLSFRSVQDGHNLRECIIDVSHTLHDSLSTCSTWHTTFVHVGINQRMSIYWEIYRHQIISINLHHAFIASKRLLLLQEHYMFLLYFIIFQHCY